MKEISISAELENIAAVSEFMEAATDELGAAPKAQMQLNVIIDELLANIICYAYPDGNGSAVVRLEAEGDFVRLDFIDSGMPFNPLEAEDPDVTLGADEREIGGLGIFMSKKLSDRMEYRREDGKNILSVWKKIR